MGDRRVNTTRFSALGAGVVLAAAMVGCGKQEPPPAPKAEAPKAPEEMVVKIGHAAPLTGGIAHLGKDNENGARLAVDEANAKGMMLDGKKVKFEFTVLTSNRPDRVDICTLLKQNLGEIGISVNVRPVEFTQMQEKMQNHDFHAAFGGWGTGTDPDVQDGAG